MSKEQKSTVVLRSLIDVFPKIGGKQVSKSVIRVISCSLLFSFLLMIPVNAANDAGISSVQKLTEEKEEASAESEDTLDEVTNTTDKEFEGSLDQPIVEEPGEVEEQPSEDIKLEETEEQTDEGDNLGEAATEQPEKESQSPDLLAASTGTWIHDSYGYWYRHSDGSYTTNGWEFIDGYWYYFGSQGYRVTGWQWIDNEWYYFNSTGKMQKGWYYEGGKTYYLDASSGVMARGWTWIVSEWYYFNSSGVMQRGWFSENGNRYYLDSSTGVMARGWKWVSTDWYYFDSSGVMYTGWLADGGKWYYLDGSGAMAKGWHYLTYVGENGGKPYYHYFNSSGEFVTDSDGPGCSHGFPTFGDYRYNISPDNVRYFSYCSENQNSEIARGTASWNNSGIAHVAETDDEEDANMLFYSVRFGQSNILAATYFIVEGAVTVDPRENWSDIRIDVDNDQGTINSGTIAHEVGHGYGLRHRITEQNSIMCQTANGRLVSTPQTIDINVLRHIYE